MTPPPTMTIFMANIHSRCTPSSRPQTWLACSRCWHWLPPQKRRRALLYESRHTFIGVIGRHYASERRFLDRQPVVDRSIHAAMHGRERRRNRVGWFSCQVRGKRKRGFEKIGRGHHTVNQPKPGGFGRVELTPGQDQLQRGLSPDVAR